MNDSNEPTINALVEIELELDNVYAKCIWNAAIEAAADLNNGLTTNQKYSIRKLKK